MASQVSHIGTGRLYIGLRSGGIMRDVGQTPMFKIEITEKSKELPNYQTGIGLADKVIWVDKITLSVELASASYQNLMMALRGVETPTTATQVTSESHTAYQGGLVELQGVSPKTVTVSVSPPAHATLTTYALDAIVKPATGTNFYKCKQAGQSGATAPTWKTDGTDTTDGTVIWTDMGTMALTASEYEVVSAGVSISENSTKIAAEGTPVAITYMTSAGHSLQLILGTGEEYRVAFAGRNFARGNKGMKVVMYRVTFAPTKGIGLISDDFMKLELVGDALSDDTKTGEGISTFGTVDIEEV